MDLWTNVLYFLGTRREESQNPATPNTTIAPRMSRSQPHQCIPPLSSLSAGKGVGDGVGVMGAGVGVSVGVYLGERVGVGIGVNVDTGVGVFVTVTVGEGKGAIMANVVK